MLYLLQDFVEVYLDRWEFANSSGVPGRAETSCIIDDCEDGSSALTVVSGGELETTSINVCITLADRMVGFSIFQKHGFIKL